MKIHKLRFVLSLILGIAFSMSAWQIAQAWTSSGTWISSTQYYRFNSSVPTSFRTYINKGSNAWTNVTPSSWTWKLSSITGMPVSYASIDGPDLALAITSTTIFNGTTIVSVTMKFDNSENWYAGTGVPASNQYDLWSTAAHEMGHGLGLGHTSGIYCPGPGNTNNATMCDTMPKGSYYNRTLAGDDRNGVNALYP